MSNAPTYLDIPQQETIERALRKSEERFRQVVEAAPNAMVMINSERDRSKWSTRRRRRIFGYERARNC